MKNADGDSKKHTESDQTPTPEIAHGELAVSVVASDKKRKSEERRHESTSTGSSSPDKHPKNETNDSVEAPLISSVGRPPKSSRKAAGKSSQSPGGGRVRLPDKLLKHLNGEPMTDVFWWLPGGDGFAYNVGRVQAEFLDVHFSGTKLASFVRSLNRW